MPDADLQKYEVQCGRTLHEAVTVSVAATSNDEACRIAIGLADHSPSWKATGDPVSATFVDALGPDEEGAWSEANGGEAAVPYRYTERGTLFPLPWQPAGHVDLSTGTYLVEYVSPDIGCGVAYGAFEYDPDAPAGSRWSEPTGFETAPIEAVRVCPYPTPDDGPRAFQLPPAVSADDVAVLLATIRDLVNSNRWQDTALYGDGARLSRIVRALDMTEEELADFSCAEFRDMASEVFKRLEDDA